MTWIEHTVAASESGLSVNDILRGPLEVSGRMIQRLTRSRGIRLNRRPTRLDRAVREGDVVAVRVADTRGDRLEPVEMPLSIIYEDDDVVVVDKPAGLLVHPVAPHHRATLAHGLAHYLSARGGGVHPVHRLDRDTSGLVVVAKSSYAHQQLDRQLREGTLTREYLALVAGVIGPSEGEVGAPIGPHPRVPSLRAVRSDGAAARTRFTVLRRSATATALLVQLETGRTHQIRVHLAYIGHPVLGDRAYGGPQLAGLRRQALHAWRVGFDRPRSGERVEIEAPIPPDLDEIYNAMA